MTTWILIAAAYAAVMLFAVCVMSGSRDLDD